MRELQPKVAVIGAGFSGVAVAAQVLSRARAPVGVLLINRGELMARGTAYGTHSPYHLLNVPAARMGLFRCDPEGFLRFLHRHVAPEIRGGEFVGRHLYGQYLEEVLNRTAFCASGGVELQRLIAEVTAIRAVNKGFDIQLDGTGGGELRVQSVVLALGNHAPRTPIEIAAVTHDARYVSNPWAHDLAARVTRDQPVAFIGTGLTMVDALIQLRRWGHPGPFYATSRRGLMPIAHSDQDTSAPAVDQDALLQGPRSAHGLLRKLRTMAQAHSEIGGDWRDVLASLRGITPQIWSALPLSERARFLRHARRYWDIHRHRLAPAPALELQALRDAGVLSLICGRIIKASAGEDGIELQIAPGANCPVKVLHAGTLINCTGPNPSLTEIEGPLFKQLLDEGLIRADQLNLGLEVDAEYQPLGVSGNPTSGLHYLGPMLQARYWECTAVPELRMHAERLGELILDDLCIPHLAEQDALNRTEGVVTTPC